ncbi:hypothetical protein BN2476_350267 [Paraburkholderia piptadeniae]|uniref:Uncharacterized protein n=1 Tax=Paraburkholderia piptadeniae TaxID=1701573 RepID=A0A1N7S8U0_9BURK|nr:hypothetical protein [Paraburkholderia piptadeniae]SIT43741.1 hypothetical protein BN2476_350267 [Paraburkholderia piptadeniae]
MSDTVHPNMFPRVADMAMNPEAIAAEQQPVNGEPPARPSTAWANPVSSLKHAAKPAADETKVKGGEPEAPKTGTVAPKSETKTRAEQAIACLRLKGPLPSKALCESMGLDTEVGISPYIAAALKRGEIVRDRGHYFLPGQEASLPAPKEPPQPKPAKKADAPRAMSSEQPAAVKPVDEDVKSDPRVADFTLGIGDAVLTHWLDGSVTLQRGAAVLELAREQTRMLTMFVALCK